MTEGREIIRAEDRKMVALDPGQDGSVEYNNWHAISSGLLAQAENLAHLGVDDLPKALKELEAYLAEYFPRLNTDIGLAQETLDFAPIGPVKEFAARILARFFPAFNTIVRRADQREGAEARIKTLERVREQMTALRLKLTEKIDEAIWLSLEKTDPSTYGRLSAKSSRESGLKGRLVKLQILLEDKALRTFEELGTVGMVQLTSDAGINITAHLNFYQEVTGNALTTAGKLSYTELMTKLEGAKAELDGELEMLKRDKAAILQSKRHELNID